MQCEFCGEKDKYVDEKGVEKARIICIEGKQTTTREKSSDLYVANKMLGDARELETRACDLRHKKRNPDYLLCEWRESNSRPLLGRQTFYH